jgi:hypothetical protein
VHDRLIVAIVPLFLILFAHGLVTLATAVLRRGLNPRECVLGFAPLAVLVLIGLLRAPSFAYATESTVPRDAGLWLRDRFPQHMRVMTGTPSIALYFYDAPFQENVVVLPWAPYEAFLAAARQKADLVAVAEWQLEAAGFPAARRLAPAGDHPGLTHVGTVGRTSQKVHVFTVDPPAARTAEP